MKIIIFIILIIVTGGECVNAQLSPVRLELNLDKKITKEEQTAYWVSLKGKQVWIVDSCIVHKGQKKTVLEGHPQYSDDYYNSFLMFSKMGTITGYLILAPGENVKLGINELEDSFAYIEGSLGTEEKNSYFLLQKINYQKITQLESTKDSLIHEKNYDLSDKIADSITYYKEDKRLEILLNFLKTVKSPQVYLDLLTTPSIKPIPQDTIDNLISIMKKRFPNEEIIQQYLYKRSLSPATENTKQVEARINQIRNSREKWLFPVSTTKTSNINIDTVHVQQFVMGDKVEGISLQGLNEKNISLDEIKTPYVLIDFWAAWCGPCRREFPNLKAASEKYKNKLTIYAISLDNNEKEWRKIIETEKLETFTHVYGGNFFSQEAEILCKHFNIKAIPANFLLDKNRNIIGVNLRGKALEQKMEELATVLDK